jgi:hypothetical protein
MDTPHERPILAPRATLWPPLNINYSALRAIPDSVEIIAHWSIERITAPAFVKNQISPRSRHGGWKEPAVCAIPRRYGLLAVFDGSQRKRDQNSTLTSNNLIDDG